MEKNLLSVFKQDADSRLETAKKIKDELGNEAAINLVTSILDILGNEHQLIWELYTREELNNLTGKEVTDSDMEECQDMLDSFNPCDY